MIRRPQSLTTIILNELETLIMSGELSPGEPINEKAFAEKNAVSRGPIREACRRLEQAGLVEIIVNRGVFVRKVAPKDAADLCDIRAMLSGYAGKILAERITGEQAQTLTSQVERMEALAASGDLETFYPLNTEFHAAIFDFTGNERLGRMYEEISKELHLFRWRALVVDANLGKSLEEHREILEALIAHDPLRAAKAHEDHSLAVKKRLLGTGLGG
jgi:DNA-binding GntR family transcriptional regulator